jgi:nitronate monooxygenase
MLRRSNGRVDGLIVEMPTAGGRHNGSPRGKTRSSIRRTAVYGDKDVVDLAKLRESSSVLLAGGYATPERFQHAIAAGASGVQIGTAFAFCEESDWPRIPQQRSAERSRRRGIRCHRSPRLSDRIPVQGRPSRRQPFGGRAL